MTHLADNGCANQLIIGDYNSSMNTDLDYVGYSQDPHHASREFLFGLQEDNAFIDVYRFLHPYDLSYTCKVHNIQQPSRIYIALGNQNLISGVTRMKHTWKQSKYSDHAMVTVVVDFETIEKGHGMSIRALS